MTDESGLSAEELSELDDFAKRLAPMEHRASVLKADMLLALSKGEGIVAAMRNMAAYSREYASAVERMADLMEKDGST